MTDPVVAFVTDWIAENVTPEIDGAEVDPETVQEHFGALLDEAKDDRAGPEQRSRTGTAAKVRRRDAPSA